MKIAVSIKTSLPPGSYGAAGVAMTHHPSRHIMEYTGSRPNDRIVANRDSRGYEHICGNPNAVSHGYGGLRGLEVRVVMIMPRSAQKAFLRDNGLFTDLDGGDGIKPGIVTDPRIVANLDAPGKMEPRPGMQDYLFAELTTEYFEQSPAETIARQGRKAEQGVLAEEPKENDKLRAAIVEPGMVPFVKTKEWRISSQCLPLAEKNCDFLLAMAISLSKRNFLSCLLNSALNNCLCADPKVSLRITIARI